MSAASLLARGQLAHAAHHPATIALAGQSYDCGISDLSRRGEPGEFGTKAERRVAFWLPLAAFTAAGQPEPTERQLVECSAPATHAGTYEIEEVVIPPTGNTLTLRCKALAQ